MPTRPKRSNKPTGLLAAFAETKKVERVLLGDLQAHVLKRSQQDNDRRQDIIHPSEMAKSDWCPRATAFRISGTQPSNKPPVNSHRMETIFQEGHDIHTKWQTWLREMGVLWGKWKCTTCEHTWMGDTPLLCPACQAENGIEYKEVPLDGEEKWLIAGHADGAVPEKRSLVEVKSVGLGTVRMEEPELVRKYTVKTEDGKRVVDYDALFKGIQRPLKSHRKQAIVYLAIARYYGWPFDQMVFIYENKANQETKEFVLRYSEDAAEELLETALDIKWAVEQGHKLPRPPEMRRDQKPCTACVFRDLCWGVEDGKERNAEPDAADGAGVTGSEEATGPAEHLHADPAGRRVPRTAGRPHRTGRQRVDESVRPTDEVGGVPERPVGSGRGRRTVRRRRT
jgi:rubrerythrin